jgi:hypothetical protein
VLFAAEQYPRLRARALPVGGSADVAAGYDLVAELEVYDLAVAQRLEIPGRASVLPWLGVSHLRVDETRTTLDGSMMADDGLVDDATTRLWGVVAGFDGSVRLSASLGLTGRVAVRWAQGTRRAWLSVATDSDDPQATRVRLSDSTERAMWGAEAGLRWLTWRGLRVEGGWRFRDWRHDGGLATFDGPFVRLAAAY